MCIGSISVIAGCQLNSINSCDMSCMSSDRWRCSLSAAETVYLEICTNCCFPNASRSCMVVVHYVNCLCSQSIMLLLALSCKKSCSHWRFHDLFLQSALYAQTLSRVILDISSGVACRSFAEEEPRGYSNDHGGNFDGAANTCSA